LPPYFTTRLTLFIALHFATWLQFGQKYCHSNNHFMANGHYIVQPVLDDTPRKELEDFVTAKFYNRHARADGN